MTNSDSSPHDDRVEPDARSTHRSEAGADVVTSDRLMKGRREIDILHAGLRYRLRVTANGKLILTK